MKLNIIKSTRTIEVPSSATKEELIEILCKWAPIIANDNDKTKYTHVPILESVKTTNNSNSSTPDFMNMFSQKNNEFNDFMDLFKNSFGKR